MNKIIALLVVVGLFATLSCKKIPPIATYHIQGKVIDHQSQGIQDITIQSSLAHHTLTDQSGNFRLDSLTGILTIFPMSDDYTFDFDPSEITVTETITNLEFVATPIISDEEVLLKNWLRQQQLTNGLLPSVENGTLISLYDQSLAALAFLAYGDIASAEQIFDFFKNRIDSELLDGLGGFSQFRDPSGNPNNHRWMGDNAWLLIALNNYEAITGSQQYNRLSTELANWLMGLQDTDGGLWGGYRDNDDQIHKITEGNIDAFNAIKGYTSFHQNLLLYLKNDRWDATTQDLVSWPTNPQYFYALDLHSWGYCIFEDFPQVTLTNADRYLTTQTATVNGQAVTGYCFDVDKDVVWLEGTGEMIVAFNKAGMTTESAFYLKEMEKIIIPSTVHQDASGIPYAANFGSSYGSGMLWQGVDTKAAISSTAWYLFAKKGFDPFAVEYHKNIPDADKFW